MVFELHTDSGRLIVRRVSSHTRRRGGGEVLCSPYQATARRHKRHTAKRRKQQRCIRSYQLTIKNT